MTEHAPTTETLRKVERMRSDLNKLNPGTGAADRDVVRAAADRVLALEAAREVSSDV